MGMRIALRCDPHIFVFGLQVLGKLLQIGQRTLALLADGDLMLPSGQEGAFLRKNLLRCTVRVLRHHGHALM